MMGEPVRLYAADGTQFDCTAPSEVARLLASGEWRREPWPVIDKILTNSGQPQPLPAKPKPTKRQMNRDIL